MPGLEHGFIARWPASAWIKTGCLLMVLGAAPLLLYTAFGPADGNPIGLGLLMAVAVPIGFLLLGIGALKWLIAWLQSRP